MNAANSDLKRDFSDASTVPTLPSVDTAALLSQVCCAHVSRPMLNSLKHLYFAAQTNAAGYTALHVAAAASAGECIAELLVNGAPVDGTDILGNTALHVMVAASDAPESVLLLLNYRADPNIGNDDGNSALHIAALHNRHRCLQQLLLHGGEPAKFNVYGLSAHDLAMRR